MKKILFFKTFSVFFLLPLILTGCTKTGPMGPAGVQGEIGPQGPSGEDGISIISIEKTSTEGNIDTYTITYSNGTTTTFTVVNGMNGEQGIQGVKGEDGHTPIISIGENGNWYVDGVDTGISAHGQQGEKGENGASLLNGHGAPNEDLGITGDSYIDLDSWNYYIKGNDGWELCGNIKGQIGEVGQQGISIESVVVNENGDLIITLSNGETINAGQIKDSRKHTVNFYCDDLLIDTQVVTHGEKVSKPVVEDFNIKHWYIDKEFEYEWYWYGCVVTEDMSLYGKYTAIEHNSIFDDSAHMSIDEFGFGFTENNGKEVCVSKGIETTTSFAVLEKRGIAFNKSEIGLISTIVVDISYDNFETAKLYYGNAPLSFTHCIELNAGINTCELNNNEYFTIQNEGEENITINSINIAFVRKTVFNSTDLPKIIINTENNAEVASRENYVNCSVTTDGASKDVKNLSGKIKLRGNTTYTKPKKPYRIKLDKKNSLFGLEKNKDWVLLADYLDGSKMHNYAALTFAKMLRGENSFAVTPFHVNLILNGENMGLYVFCEHINEKSGRLNIEQDKLWEKNFDEINFYVERDSSTDGDPTEVEGETFFKIYFEDYTVDHYTFALKYPEKSDFEEEKDDGTIDYHEAEFSNFFESLYTYFEEICNAFIAYKNDSTHFSDVAELVDIDSLVTFAVVDQLFLERDHRSKSFKMYRENGGLLKFGPNWDYDLCVCSLVATYTYINDPYGNGDVNAASLIMGEEWMRILIKDEYGRSVYRAIWNTISEENIIDYLSQQEQEMNRISKSAIKDCQIWMNNQYYVLFDNQHYLNEYLNFRIYYLKAHV